MYGYLERNLILYLSFSLFLKRGHNVQDLLTTLKFCCYFRGVVTFGTLWYKIVFFLGDTETDRRGDGDEGTPEL